MGLTARQKSILEAIAYVQRECGKASNKAVREYYDKRQGSGLAFFHGFTGKGAPQKTIYRNVLRLESLGMVKVLRKKVGRKRLDYYELNKEGAATLQRERLREKVTRTLPGLLEIIQAPLPAKLMTVEK